MTPTSQKAFHFRCMLVTISRVFHEEKEKGHGENIKIFLKQGNTQ